MASPLPSRKQSVSLASSGVDSAKYGRVSRIRRDPPPPVLAPEVVIAKRNERDAWIMAIGVVALALAMVAIGIAAMSWAGWSPRSYRLDV